MIAVIAKLLRQRTAVLVFAFLFVLSALAYAEPSGPTGHHVPLRILALAVSLIAGTLPWLIRKQLIADGWSQRQLWLLSIAMVILAGILVAPMIIVLGSILWTGRTM